MIHPIYVRNALPGSFSVVQHADHFSGTLKANGVKYIRRHLQNLICSLRTIRLFKWRPGFLLRKLFLDSTKLKQFQQSQSIICSSKCTYYWYRYQSFILIVMTWYYTGEGLNEEQSTHTWRPKELPLFQLAVSKSGGPNYWNFIMQPLWRSYEKCMFPSRNMIHKL